jgi:hypothetical protein
VPIIRKLQIYIGIDPGKSGGIAALDLDNVLTIKMPETPADVLDYFHSIKNYMPINYSCIAIIEQVGGYTGQGQPGSAMFKFGQGVGHLEMALLACSIPSESVPPRKWQKALGISAKKKTETKTQWKNRLKSVAQRLFPSEKITLATADALLIAEYCRRKHQGTLQ